MARVYIRKYQAGDGPAVRWLVSKGVMVTVNPFFLSASVKEGVIQLILMTAAVLFIAVGTTLRNSLLAIPIVLALLYAGIYIGHWVKISRTHGDLEDIDTSYSSHSKKGFWVAVLLSPEGKTNSITTDYTFITDEDHDLDSPNFDKSLHPTKKTLLATLAVDIKADPDMREPPASVAMIKRMTVAAGHRRRGVGTAILEVALRHCVDARFRAVELITTEHHQAARSLYANWGFEFQQVYRKNYLVWGIVSLAMFRLRVPCVTISKKLRSSVTNDDDDDQNEDLTEVNTDATTRIPPLPEGWID